MENRIPKALYLDREEMMENDKLVEVPSHDPCMVRYVNIPRLWHSSDEEPKDGELLLVELNHAEWDMKFDICTYRNDTEQYSNAYDSYKDKHIKRWCYLKDITE